VLGKVVRGDERNNVGLEASEEVVVEGFDRSVLDRSVGEQIAQQDQTRIHHRNPLAMFQVVVVVLERALRVVWRIDVNALHATGRKAAGPSAPPDLDGRGSLSQEELVAFASYFLDICLDQVRFMRERLSFETLKERLRVLLLHLQQAPWQIGSEKSVVKIEALEALHYVAMTGPIERSRFVAVTGLGERTGRRVLTSLLDYGVLSAESPRGPIAFALPLASLGYLFPSLWPETETE
jgi:hypothetical protein